MMYRYEETFYAAPTDEFCNPQRGFGSVEVHLVEFEIVKRTPKGVWIDLDRWRGSEIRPINADSGHKFILLDARKRYACPTKEEAAASFLARKRAQIRIHTARVEGAKRAIARFNADHGEKHMESRSPP